ncbi:MAG: nitrophenyl compound nitroreductase subunit ArsF family protein [Bacteroidota bacterium]
MKKLFVLIASTTFMMLITFTSCNSQTDAANDDKTEIDSDQQEKSIVTVYYFHGDRRCTTCKAVGRVSEETIVENFGDNPNVIFENVNIDEIENNEIKDKLEMSGSGLFVYDGVKKVDLTAAAFQKAVNRPEELSEKIISTINEMLF